jgi:hypothetical protein
MNNGVLFIIGIFRLLRSAYAHNLLIVVVFAMLAD